MTFRALIIVHERIEINSLFNSKSQRDFPADQWLRFCASVRGCSGLILGQEPRPCSPKGTVKGEKKKKKARKRIHKSLEMSVKIKYFELCDTENNIQQNLWDTA